ncbi:adenylyl-sulfate kinase [Rhizobium sp. NXC24]|uniref:adenylyl-sulfate kinase n=1 Tax=Rhizobium sp. NXC24 TaxID=2048897 RepID=UPI000CDF3763|nr:adenylyl-sulfate kinase [Rhizobium sp. NXC24]AVA25715.1 bifunctional sulfate adenylyltransferase subunit 1/adenylylsulfate kinase [Rhizobium sp. NXC24]
MLSLDQNSNQDLLSSEEVFARFQHQEQSRDILRLITCGSVDDGKSTLIGRLLWESQQLLDDQLAALKAESKGYGTQGDEIDLALLVDGLSAEREQGITIDVAYRYFSTPKRKFILADCPGHEQYTRNMATAASSADVAILLVDARKGVLTQTRRHAYLASLLGVRHVVAAINKMDSVGYDEQIFDQICEEISTFSATLGFESITQIPISALCGDNIARRAAHTPWYLGPPLMDLLETVKITRTPSDRLVIPVQWINRPTADFRGVSATIVEGKLEVGDEIRVTASGQVARVAEIVTMDGTTRRADEGAAVTFRLDRDIDVCRGDVLSYAQKPLEMSDHIEATLIWMSADAGLIGRQYEIKLATQWASASITSIKYHIDVDTFAHTAGRTLALNDIAVCNVSLSRPLVFDSYSTSKTLGAFILVDRYTNETVAAGMIRHNLRRAQNVHHQMLSITRQDRERLNEHQGKVIWFTGLSGSGKSTLANALEMELHNQGKRTYILDGDNIRQGLNKDLGFTDADRVENIRRIAEVAKLMMDAGLIVLTAFISPFRREREMARELIGLENFLEVFVDTPLDICEQRDPKGLYRKARDGKLPNMTGVSSPYEAPTSPDFVIQGVSTPLVESVKRLVDYITFV